jgi:hypothetical protein
MIEKASSMPMIVLSGRIKQNIGQNLKNNTLAHDIFSPIFCQG